MKKLQAEADAEKQKYVDQLQLQQAEFVLFQQKMAQRKIEEELKLQKAKEQLKVNQLAAQKKREEESRKQQQRQHEAAAQKEAEHQKFLALKKT